MKHSALSLLFILIAILFTSCQKQPTETKSAAPSPSASAPLTGPPGFPPPIMNKPYPGTGVVAQINRAEGWIEINHEEIKGLMPAMQMEFNVKDKTLLDKVKVGERVEFVVIETEKGEFLTEIKPAARSSP